MKTSHTASCRMSVFPHSHSCNHHGDRVKTSKPDTSPLLFGKKEACSLSPSSFLIQSVSSAQYSSGISHPHPSLLTTFLLFLSHFSCIFYLGFSDVFKRRKNGQRGWHNNATILFLHHCLQLPSSQIQLRSLATSVETVQFFLRHWNSVLLKGSMHNQVNNQTSLIVLLPPYRQIHSSRRLSQCTLPHTTPQHHHIAWLHTSQ